MEDPDDGPGRQTSCHARQSASLPWGRLPGPPRRASARCRICAPNLRIGTLELPL